MSDIGTPSIVNAPAGTAADSGGQLTTLALGDDAANGNRVKGIGATMATSSGYLFGGLAIIVLILAAIAFLAYKRRQA